MIEDQVKTLTAHTAAGLSSAQICERMGLSYEQYRQLNYVAQSPPEVQRLVFVGHLAFGTLRHLRPLSKLLSPDSFIALCRSVAHRGLSQAQAIRLVKALRSDEQWLRSAEPDALLERIHTILQGPGDAPPEGYEQYEYDLTSMLMSPTSIRRTADGGIAVRIECGSADELAGTLARFLGISESQIAFGGDSGSVSLVIEAENSSALNDVLPPVED